jgi:hypothetical protein
MFNLMPNPGVRLMMKGTTMGIPAPTCGTSKETSAAIKKLQQHAEAVLQLSHETRSKACLVVGEIVGESPDKADKPTVIEIGIVGTVHLKLEGIERNLTGIQSELDRL